MDPSDEASELRARVEALEASLRRERAMFAGGPVVFFRWIATEGWPVEHVSGNVRELFGREGDDFLAGRVAYAEVVHPDDVARVAAEVAHYSEIGAQSFEQDYRIVRADGSVRWLYDFTAILRDDGGRVTHYHGYVLDISARREAEAAVRQRDEQLRRAQKMEALGRLAGGIAHDFNNLLTAVNGYVDLAMDLLPPDAGARVPLGRVRASVERAAAMTRQLLAFSRRQVLEPRVVELGAVVTEARTLLTPLLGGQQLVGELAPEPLHVRVDPSQLEQVVINLLINARDAMPHGGRVTVGTSRRELAEPSIGVMDDVIPPGSYAVLTVGDEGVGMDAATLARAFEPFFTTKGPEGNGLGLATVYGVVRQSNGHVLARSEVGRGSTFEVWLPRLEDASATPAPGESAHVPLRAGAERVLLVEDDDDIREVVRRSLEARGFEVIAKSDGVEALACLGCDPAPDVVVTDLVMPNLGGAALVERMTALGHGQPVLFVSGYADAPVPVASERPAAYVQKPFTADTLNRALRALLDRRRV